MTISAHGGRWDDSNLTGVTLRNIRDTSVDPIVASSDMQKYRFIRIIMMSTKMLGP